MTSVVCSVWCVYGVCLARPIIDRLADKIGALIPTPQIDFFFFYLVRDFFCFLPKKPSLFSGTEKKINFFCTGLVPEYFCAI